MSHKKSKNFTDFRSNKKNSIGTSQDEIPEKVMYSRVFFFFRKPKSPCSFVASQINSECAQVFNYHRLLTWDENKGLHMDVFKVFFVRTLHWYSFVRDDYSKILNLNLATNDDPQNWKKFFFFSGAQLLLLPHTRILRYLSTDEWVHVCRKKKRTCKRFRISSSSKRTA